MKQDDDNPSDPSNLMPIQVGLHSPASVPPQYHPFWTGQTMEKPPSDGTPSSSFPSSSGHGYGFKTERPDGMTSDSAKSPQQNAFQFPQGFNPAYPNGVPPLTFANGAPVMRFPNSLPSSMFPGGMPSLAVNNDALIWRMLMDTYSRMTSHRNELMKNHMNRLQMQNPVEYPMQFAAMDQRAMAHSTPSKLHENQQQSRPSFSSMENFQQQTMGLGYSSPLPNNTMDLSASKKKSSRARKMGKKSSPIPQLDDPQNLIKNFSSDASVTHPLAFSSAYSPFAFPNSVPAPHFATTSNPSPSSINVKSEPVINDTSTTLYLPPTNKETVAHSEIQSPSLRSREVLVPDHPMSCSTEDPTETGSGRTECNIRQNKSSEMRESLSRSSARKTPPEVTLKQELTSEENLLYTSGDGAEVSDMRGESPWPDKRQPSPAENENVCMDSSGSGRSLGFSLYGAAPSQHVATSLRRKKILRCRRCSFVTTEKEAFYKHKYEHFPPERLMVCTECTFVTQLKHHFQYHINTHKGVRPYPCSMCDYRGTNLAMLKSHMKTHKKYSCADCEYSASSIEILQAHMNAENHKAAPVLNAMRVMSRVVGLGNKRKNPNSRHPGGLKTRKRFALNGSQMDSVALPTTEPTDSFATPLNASALNAYHLNQSFGPSHLSPQNQLGGLGVGGSSAVWPGSLNLWPGAFPLAGSPGQLASSFALPQPLPFSAKSSENPLLTCEFCSFSTSNQSHLMHHVTSQHRQLLNSILQSSELPLDGSSGSRPMSHNRKSTPPRTTLSSPSLHSGGNSLPRFSGNDHAADNRSVDPSVIAVEKMDSQVSQGKANPVLPLDLSCVQEPCQKPSRRKGVARKLAVEQIEDEDVTEYFSDFLPTPQEFCDKSVAGAAEHVSDSREHSEMRSDPKMETELEELIQESQNKEQVDLLQETSKSSSQRLLSKPGDKPNLISGKNCKEKAAPMPPLLDVKQEGDVRKDGQLDTAKRNSATNKKSPSKTYKCHHCGIIFLDYILYSMHSGYHNFDDPLRCNICGRRSNDIHEFYTHIGKYAHPES